MFLLLGKDGAEDKLNFHKDAAIKSIEQLSSHYDIKPLLDIVELFYTRDH